MVRHFRGGDVLGVHGGGVVIPLETTETNTMPIIWH